MTNSPPTADIVERLNAQAQRASDIAREMAVDKSLRQAGNVERRTDLYMWPRPEQTVEGEAVAIIKTYEAALKQCCTYVREAIDDGALDAIVALDAIDAVACAALATQEAPHATQE